MSLAFAFRREATEDPLQRIWVLDAEGRTVGRCTTAPATERDADLGPRAAEVQALAIAASHRRRGLGHRLLGQAVNDLLVRAHAPVLTWVDPGDAAAVAFLNRHGFHADGRIRDDGAARLVRRR